MEFKFLGTGTSQGVPMIAHDSKGLDLNNPKNWRTRTSAHISCDGFHVQIDAAPEFRLQCIHNQIEQIDVFILTHGHADHVLGMDDLRRFIDLRGGEALPVFSTEEGLERVQQIFPYAIGDRPLSPGYPAFKPLLMPKEQMLTDDFKVTAVPLPHGRIDVLGLVFEQLSSGKRLAYFTDCKEVTAEAFELAYEADVIVLDALRPKEHPAHMSIDEAIQTAKELKGKQTYFTHMTYMVDHETYSEKLPEKVAFAYDGLRVKV